MTQEHDHHEEDRNQLNRQPANPLDLEAFPPQNGVCAEIRELLRDFVDGDLSGAEYTRTEAHVHECRSCGLALSRAESEVMLIESALAEVDPTVLDAPANFNRGLMREVREAAVGEPTIGFTQRVMHRVLEETMTDDVPQRGSRMPVYLLAAAAVLLATLVFVIQGGRDQAVATEVLAARDAEFVRGDERIPLTTTRRFAPGEISDTDRFVTGDAGVLELAFKGQTADGKPASDLLITAYESTSVGVRAGREAADGETALPVVALASGEVQIESDRGALVALDDGSAVQLHGGSVAVAVESVRDVASRAVLRVTVLVDAGSATVSRGKEVVPVTAGNEASYTTYSAVAVGPAPDDSVFMGSRRRANALVSGPKVEDVDQPRNFGQVLDPRTSAPVADVSVSVVTFLGTQTLRTDDHGMFRLANRGSLRGQFGLVRAVPPAGRSGLAASAVTPLQIDDSTTPRRLYLRRSQALRGRIHDAANREIPGLALQACLIDELCGMLLPLGRGVQVGARGDFQIDGLPAEVAGHERLVLVASAGELMHPQVVWSRAAVSGADTSLDLLIEPRKSVRFGGFAPGADVEILQAVHGLPLRCVHLRRILTADAQGELELDSAVTSYVLAADQAPRRLVSSGGKTESIDEPLAPSIAALRTGADTQGRMRWVRNAGVRVAEVPDLSVGAWHHGLSVHEADSAQACPGTQLFLRPPGGGGLVFLGVFNGRAPLGCLREFSGHVLARSPEGWLGGMDFDGRASQPQVSVAVERSGTIEWSGAPTGVLVLERLDHRGVAVPICRMASQKRWTLPSGDYRFRGRSFRLDADTVLTLK